MPHFRRICLLFFILSAFFRVTLAEVFTVSSNADSGQGTLREALILAAANANSQTDYIHFNLPGNSESDRTILIQSSLPALSSNLIIDGTTQPGSPIGISLAKVVIKTIRSKTSIILFQGKDISHAAFYGLFFLDTTNPGISDPDAGSRTALKLENSRDIIIGEQNKGNAFNGYNYRSIELTEVDEVKIYDNIIGQSPYALEVIGTGYIQLTNVNGLEAGKAEKGNTFFVHLSIRYTDIQKEFQAAFSHNNFNVASDGLTVFHHIDRNPINIEGGLKNLNDPKVKVKLLMEDNLFSHYDIALKLRYLDGYIGIKHNWFGIDRSGQIPLNLKKAHAGSGTAIHMEFMDAEIVIGDEDPLKKNLIAYNERGVSIGFSPKVKVIRNSFKCIAFKEFSTVFNTSPAEYQINVTQITSSYVRGTTAPGAVVDLFLSDDCINCSPETYIGSTTAQANGEWQYDLHQSYSGSILANAHLDKQSTDFTKPAINLSKAIVRHANCESGGEISGIEITNTEKVKWVDQNGQTVSTDLVLKNVLPGRYKLIAGEYCPVESEYFHIYNYKPIISASSIKINPPACGQSNGSITDLYAYTLNSAALSYSWLNQNSEVVGGEKDLTGVPDGSYTLQVSTADCSVSYGPVILQSPNAPKIDQEPAVITASVCGQSKGSITSIQASGSGTLQYRWRNESMQVVSSSRDLLHQPPGNYTLEVIDETGCSVSTPSIEIPEINGIQINTDHMVTTAATCNDNNGSITGIVINGADSYRWLDEAGNTIASTLNLSQVRPGQYRLEASNAYCSKLSREFEIASLVSTKQYPSTKVITDASCGLNNGSIEVLFIAEQPLAYRWEDTNGQVLGTSTLLQGLTDGFYQLYIIDDFGCEKPYLQYKVNRRAALNVNTAAAKITADECGQSLGAIENITVSDGLPPYRFSWYNSSGVKISDAATLERQPAGTYELYVEDQSGCPAVSASFKIEDHRKMLAPPIVNELQLCAAGEAFIMIENFEEDCIYRVYVNQESALPIVEETKRNLSVTVNSSHSFYVSKIWGGCESSRTEVKINIASTDLRIANTFTPNGDGINDLWVPTGIESYRSPEVTIYNRYGQKVFESKGIFKAFDGNLNGKPLPEAAYYYIIKLAKGCRTITGSLAIIR